MTKKQPKRRFPRTGAGSGACCACGYRGRAETECNSREDKAHCDCWWDGKYDPKKLKLKNRWPSHKPGEAAARRKMLEKWSPEAAIASQSGVSAG
jgi:hypothetical protein